MKVVMSIDEYKKYKNGELSLVQLKMRDIEYTTNKTLNWVFKHKAEISLTLSAILCEVLPIKV